MGKTFLTCPNQLESSEAGFHGWMGELAGKHGSNHQTLHFADLLGGKYGCWNS